MTISITSVEKRLVWMIRDLVIQNCFDHRTAGNPGFDDPTPVFSGFIGKHAEAIALLNEYGLVTDFTDNGGRVVAGTILNLVDTAKVLKTGPFKDEDARV